MGLAVFFLPAVGEQCGPRSDASESEIRLGSARFAKSLSVLLQFG